MSWTMRAIVLLLPTAALAAAPAGYRSRELARMPEPPVKITSDPAGRCLYVLAVEGSVYRIDLPHGGEPRKIIDRSTYAPGPPPQSIGIAFDRERRLYLVGNRFDHDVTPAMNRVTIYRTAPVPANGGGDPADPRPWLTADIPFAVNVFQHSVSSIALGPDGFLYVSSGSRTDHGEAGTDPKISKEGETPISACIWRLDPGSERPQIEVFARGLRNAFGLCWDDRGRMFATENGPNADPPEEVNLIERGKHYGFPHVFADWKDKAYPDQPPAAPTEKFEPPFATLDPHSSPSGIAYHDGALLVARFGNLLPLAKDVGFDIVRIDMNGKVTPFMSEVARPTDLHKGPNGKLYIVEHQSQTRNGGEPRPGRIVELWREEKSPAAEN